MAIMLSKSQLSNALSVCACLNLRKATRVVTQHFDDTLAPTGLRSTQFVILVTAFTLDGPTIAQLAESLVTDRTTLTRGLKPLIKSGFLRFVQGKDRRYRRMVLTPKGAQAVKRAVPYWAKAQSHVTSGFGKKWNPFLCDLSHAVDIIRRTPRD